MARLLLVIIIGAVLVFAIMQFTKPNVAVAPTGESPKISLSPTSTPSITSKPTLSPSITKSVTPIPTTSSENPAYKSKVLISGVPFTPQAPFAEWSDARFQEGCEEASSLMAVYWAKNIESGVIDKTKAKNEIIAMAAYQQERWGEARDTSTKDTATRIISGYLEFSNYEIRENISLQDIKNELLKGNLLIVPANGRALNNPHFTAPGPDRHMIVIRGYDDNTKNFITNDPGIREGELYTYPQQLFFDAIRDYPTGFNLPIEGNKKVMIVIKK